ncbi:unnamed protein product, partial [Vitis vinifera]
MDSSDVFIPDDIPHGRWVPRNKPFSFIQKDVSVHPWIHAYHRGTPKYMGLEEIPIPVISHHSIFLICYFKKLCSLTKKGQPH